MVVEVLRWPPGGHNTRLRAMGLAARRKNARTVVENRVVDRSIDERRQQTTNNDEGFSFHVSKHGTTSGDNRQPLTPCRACRDATAQRFERCGKPRCLDATAGAFSNRRTSEGFSVTCRSQRTGAGHEGDKIDDNCEPSQYCRPRGHWRRRVQLRHELYYDYRQRRRCPAALCCCSAAAASTIQLFTFLHDFTGSDISHAENSDSKLHNRFCCFVPHRPASSLLLPKRCTTRRRDMATPRLVALILATTCLWSVGDGAAAPYLSEARPVKAGPAPSARQSAGRNTASRKPRELYYHDGWRTCFINNTQLPSMGALSVDFMTLFR